MNLLSSIVPSSRSSRLRALLAIVVGASALLLPAREGLAQTGGEAGIQGTVTDTSGAVVPHATVTAIDQASGVSTVRTTSGDGLYTISPIIAGVYTVHVTAAGFADFTQKNLTVDALKLTGLNVKLAIGPASAEVTVTAAPPQLETTNATLGGVMENQTYQNLPILMGGQQRDATAFATLLPGAQPGARTPIISGTGNYLAEVSLDGIPATTGNMQGDNRVIFNAVPVDAVDQFQLLSSSPPVEYQGAGLLNFTVKSGGEQYHGTVADFIRNTAFDTWGFSAPYATQKNAAGQTVPAPKPVEHQNELVATAGGPIPFTRHKGFFFVTYDRYHGRSGVTYNTLTVPTTAMRTGDFSQLLQPCTSTTSGCVGILPNNVPCIVGTTCPASVTSGNLGVIFDPTTTAACTAANGGTVCRYPFPGNVIPANEISPISLYNAQWLPDPTNNAISNNYLGGVANGYDNWEFVTREDFDLTAKQRLSFVFADGSRTNAPYAVGNSGVVLPFPYTEATEAVVRPIIGTIEHAYTISNRLVNQFRYGIVYMGGPPIKNITDGVAGYQATDSGITGLPPGQASTDFAAATFGTNTLYPNGISQWQYGSASGATQTSVATTYTLKDNVLYTAGAHSFTFGFQYQWVEDNASTEDSASYSTSIAYNPTETAGYNGNSLNTATTGYSYASYLLGAASSTSQTVQPFSVVGGRYRTAAPYVEDDWKVTPKLTLNIGLRWDYLPTYHEVQDRWSFLNPTLTNPATGNLGALQFAGNRGAGFSCECRTPVQTYWKNFGPRLGLAYAVTERTVIRAGAALVYSHAGGTGGRQGAATGTGQTGFNATESYSDSATGLTAAPAFYLNNSPYFTAHNIANTRYGGPNANPPVPQTPSAASESLNAGNYLNGSSYVTPSSIAYPDPYISGRAPEFLLFNAGIQQAITNALTLTLNYAGSQSHFVATGSNVRGYWANQLDPRYLAELGGAVVPGTTTPLLTAQATAANIAAAQAIDSSIKVPYPGFAAAGAVSSKVTIEQMLVAFPQYSSVTDIWGINSGNISYNSLQMSINQRPWHGLTYTVNYTWSKNIGDDGTFRSGFPIPAAAISSHRAWKQDRVERGLVATDIPQNLNIYGVWQLPGAHAANRFVRTVAGGWQLSSIYSRRTGVPLAITTSCTDPGQGQCMPDLNPAYPTSSSARINGEYKDLTVATLGKKQFISNAAFSQPPDFNPAQGGSAIQLLGDAPRTAPYDLRAPNYWDQDAGIRRSFNITPERVRFIFQVDCSNIYNHPTPGTPNTTWGATSTSFGTIGSESGNRSFQFAGRINY